MPIPASNSRFPLESFDPRYATIWRKALLGEVKIIFPNPKTAMTFQIRLHMYRSKLKKSGNADADLMYRAKTSRIDNILYIRPADAKFADVLDQFETPSAPVVEGEVTGLAFEDLFTDFQLNKEPPDEKA